MANPKFSVVIPTRERHETLQFCLETCLKQDFDDFEIVVSDNCSSPATRAVVERFASPRIVYHRSDRPLSMQDNYNLAYSLSRGDWVTYIGDDDGLMPFCFRQLHRAIMRHDVKAVRWNYAIYSWPTIVAPELANYMSLCLLRGEEVLDSLTTMKDVLRGRVSPGLLPNVYHGAVARDVLEEVRSRTGVVFAGVHPDTYSSFCNAYVCGRVLSLTIPMSVSGFSGASGNISFSFVRRKHATAKLLQEENRAHGVRPHPWIPDLPSLLSVVYDSFLLAKRDLFPDDHDIVLDRKAFSERFLNELPIDDLTEWPDSVAEIRRSLADDPGLVRWFDGLARKTEPMVRSRDPFRPDVLGYEGGFLHIDTAKCGVSDVTAASRLASAILNYDRDDVAYDLVGLVARRPKTAVDPAARRSLATRARSLLAATARTLHKLKPRENG